MRGTMSRRIQLTPFQSRARWLWLMALWCLLSACAGGSGSSGFDAVLAENRAINKALDTDGCEVVEGLTICAAGGATPSPIDTATAAPAAPTQTPVPTQAATSTATLTSPTEGPTQGAFTATASVDTTTTPTGTAGPLGTTTETTTPLPSAPTPTPTTTKTQAARTATATPSQTEALPSFTATPSAQSTASDSPTPTATPIPGRATVDTDIGASDTVPCQPGGSAGTCTFVFTFRPVGLPSTAVYRVAVRSRTPDGEWQIFAAPGNSVTLQLNTSNPSTEYQIAVLAFLQDPGFVPATVLLLGDTGADFAFVTPPLRPE